LIVQFNLFSFIIIVGLFPKQKFNDQCYVTIFIFFLKMKAELIVFKIRDICMENYL